MLRADANGRGQRKGDSFTFKLLIVNSSCELDLLPVPLPHNIETLGSVYVHNGTIYYKLVMSNVVVSHLDCKCHNGTVSFIMELYWREFLEGQKGRGWLEIGRGVLVSSEMDSSSRQHDASKAINIRQLGITYCCRARDQ